MHVVIKCEQGYYAGINPAGVVQYVGTLEGAAILDVTNATALVLDDVVKDGRFLKVEVTEPEKPNYADMQPAIDMAVSVLQSVGKTVDPAIIATELLSYGPGSQTHYMCQVPKVCEKFK